jgi:hypothetical protein
MTRRTARHIPPSVASDFATGLKCHEILPGNENDPGDLPVTCTREAGHTGQHGGGTRGCTIEWGFIEPTALPEDDETQEAE